MTDQFTKPFTDLMKAGTFAQIPTQMQTVVEDGIAKTRDAALKGLSAAKDGAIALGKSSFVAQKETSAFTSKAFDHAIENTESAFVAAQAVARAKSPMEAAQLHASYVQEQFGKAGEQTKELFDLWGKVAEKSVAGIKR